MSETATRDLYSALGLEWLSDLGFFGDPLAALFGQLPGDLQIGSFCAVEDGDERSYSMVLAVRETLWLALPGLEGFGLGIVRDSVDEWPLIYCEVQTGGAAPSLSIQHFPLTVEIANPLLRPVAVEGQGEVMEGFSFEIEGGFSVAGDGEVSATIDRFSLPPFEIVGTGLVLALDECRLVVRAADVDASITGLGFTSAFRGLHAAAALLDWDLPLQLHGRDLPGIHASFEDVALGNQGVSFSAQLSWPVHYQGGEFDAAQSELMGWFVDPDWTCALATLQATVAANVPTALAASGYVRIPFLDAILVLEVFSQYAGEGRFGLSGSLRAGDGETVRVPLGHPDHRLELHGLDITADLQQGREQLEFAGRTGCVLELPGLQVTAASTAFSFGHSAQGERYLVELEQIDIDHVGQIARARLEIVVRRGADGARELDRFELKAAMAWSDLSSRIALATVPAAFPLPPDDAEVTLILTWAGDQMQLRIEATLEDVDALWRFVPAAQRPQVATAAITVALIVDGAAFDGELGLKLRLRLPDLAGLPGLAAAGLDDLVRVDSGDAEGWIDAEFKAALSSEDGSATGALSASLANPVALAFNLPGLVLPRPPLEVRITGVSLRLSEAAGQAEGEFKLSGDFALRPILPSDLGGLVPSAMAVHLERLFAVAQLGDLVGSAELRLGQATDGAYLAFEGRFSEAGLTLDLFDMLAGAAAGLTGGGAQGSEIDLDIEVSFALKSIALSVGQVPGAPTGAGGADGLPWRFGFACELGFAGQSADIAFELSHESLRFGLVELRVPVALPQLPLSRADLDALRDAAGRWDPAIWDDEIEPQIAGLLAADQDALAVARARLEQLGQGSVEDAAGAQAASEAFELRFREIPELQKEILHFTGKKFLAEAVLAVHRMLGQLSGAAGQANYQTWVEVYQEAVDRTFGMLHFDTGLQFVISDASFVLPFNDPSAIRVEGGASLQGFLPDSPLAPLGDLVFKLGLSADAIYFAVEGGAEPIALPSFGRYEGNAVEFDRLVIGYGYSKNSLKIDFAGALQLSPALIADADTSRSLGWGVRLPTNSRLQFKLDLIPVVLGEVDFVLPLVAFDVDLRSETLPSAAVGEPCAPVWDGLQLVAPGVLRASFERAKFAPFFGPLPAPNYLYAFDLALGNDELGFTQVCEDYQVITPVGGTLPLPFLADTTPYFERQCSSLRLAGFGIHFELRRPFPHPSPLMIFELLGFVSDMSLPIDPAGHLAALMWAELRNAQITLPPAVRGMFPALGRAVGVPLDLRIDVGTVITLAQQLAELVERLQAELAQGAGDVGQAVQRLIDQPPALRIDELLASLPRELRRVELEGSFVGFDASAVFLLVTPDALRRTLEPAAPPPAPAGMRWVEVAHDRFTRGPLRGWRAVDHGLKRGRGDWAIEHGALVQRHNVGDNSAGRYGAMLIRETEPLSDLRVSVDLHSADNDGMGIVFHVQGDTSFYRFRMTAEQGHWQLMRLKRGVTRMLHETATAFVPGKDYRVRIEARSVPQAAASLPLALGRRGARIAAPAPPGRRAEPATSTHIQVWVNDALWCDVADADAPLTAGQVGLDSWWTQGVRFDDFLLERAERGPIGPPGPLDPGVPHEPLGPAAHASAALARELLPLAARSGRALGAPAGPAPRTAGAAAWAAGDLAGFDDEDLLQALPAGVAAVVVAARVRVFGSQVYRFVGAMRSDGGFRLVTAANVAPLSLSVAGIEAGLPAQVQGRLMLEGRSAGADSWARVQASLFADWTLLPAAGGALARLVVGSAKAPASLALGSRGDFRLQGSGALHLFADALAVEGQVDISDRHAFVAGALSFAPPLFIAGSQRVLELALGAEGRVGPGRRFALAGEGSLKLLGKTFTRVAGELTPDGVALQAQLDADDEPWDLKGYKLQGVQLALRGRVGFGGALPELLFEGTGRMKIGDVDIDGQCRVSAGAGNWCLAAAGQLHWQGRDWLQGAVELCQSGLTVQGQTRFALQLTPPQGPANLQVASLVLSATVGGRFSVRSSGRLKACRFDLDWTLAVRLPGQQAEQMLPIAAQRLQIDLPEIASQASVKLADLITIQGLDLLPLAGASVPLPTLSDTGGTPVYLHLAVPVDPPAYSMGIKLITPIPPSPNAQPDHLGFLYEVTPTINLPAFELPIPVLSDQPPQSNPGQAPLFTLPQIGVEDVGLDGTLRLDQVNFGLQLLWKDGVLGVKVVPTGQFVAFDALPSIPRLAGQLMSGLAALRPG